MGRYGYNRHRTVLLAGLTAALDALRSAGCRRVYINGSFVSAKELPGDFDACWETSGVDLPRLGLLAPVLFDFHGRRAAQKAHYGRELFPAEMEADAVGTRFLDYFQRDKQTGRPKGIIALDPGSAP